MDDEVYVSKRTLPDELIRRMRAVEHDYSVRIKNAATREQRDELIEDREKFRKEINATIAAIPIEEAQRETGIGGR